MPAVREDLTELAASGAKSLVAAIGTDLWPMVRDLVRKVLIRRTRRRVELAQALDHMAAVAAAGQESTDTQDSAGKAAHSELVRFWAEALREIASQDPALRPALAALAGLTLPRPAPGGTAVVHQQNTARGSGRLYANQCGSQHIHVREPQDLK
ncbi:hypothetical protein ABH935_006740 [Catenulispora sp. GAS73]|uniref:hypothetical protein n=1 Tax=Catenulispora sp. GAS73 TaxID=3156269 RepID=UPI0035128478